jgi:RNA polymerase sigma factor (sigma-70 family)
LEPVFDREWHERALAGDPVAVRAFAEASLGPLYAFVLYRVGGDRSLCEDVVQETLLVALRQLDRYDPDRGGGRVLGWLTGIARNEVRRARQRGRTPLSLDALWDRMDRELPAVYAALDAQPLPDEALELEETRAMVNATMSQLPQGYRAALELKYVLGRSVREMAAELGLTEKAVESQLGRARAAFRATFTALARNLGLDPAP